ncbi:MAG: hypothetical protein FWF00_04995 [Endomicrobia bacterium]|nr:hypothetical protein [Endomicrobiia bacterium]MCL2507024.1 hypothetical protein [Endomicrobiia bacterium]
MNRSLFKAMLIFVFFIIFCSGVNASAKSNLFVVGDSILLGSGGATAYSDYLQTFLNKLYGANKIAVYNYSFYDLNTNQIYRLVENLLSKQKDTEFVVIMAGEANFYNLDGLTEYLTDLGSYSPQAAHIEGSDFDAVLRLNTAVASIYNSPLAASKKDSFGYLFSTAYITLTGAGPKKIGGYVSKIIPRFVLLSDIHENISVSASFLARYRVAWNLMNAGKHKEAEEILLLMLLENPLNSNIYYALGSLYLMQENREAEALKMFQDGILVDPFNKDNKSYKGLAIMYMSYDGEIISEILYFVRAIKPHFGEKIPEINAISAIDTADHDKKIAAVNNWILSDIRRINALTASKGVHLIVVGYPFDAKSNALLRNTFYLSSIDYIDNSDIITDSSAIQSGQTYSDMAKKVINAINRARKK